MTAMPISIALLISLEMAVEELLQGRIEELEKRGDIEAPARLTEIKRKLNDLTWMLLHPEDVQ